MEGRRTVSIESIKIGLAGLGYWGRNILRNLHGMGVLRAACDRDHEAVASLRESYPDLAFHTSFEDLLEDPAISALAIATPAATHYGLAREALRAGKDVFVEKPLALSVREGRELADLAREKDRVLMVGHTLRYHPAVRKLKELVNSGELGKVQYLYSNRLNIGRLRSEENILWSFAPHDISVMLMLTGEEPVSVAAFGEDYLSKGIYDTTLTTLEFSGGVKGHIYVSWLHPYKEQRLVVVGSRAMAVFDDVAEDKLRLYPHRIEWKDGRTPVARKAEYQSVHVEEKEPLREELEHFLSCVRERRIPLTDSEEALRVLAVLEAAEASLRSGSRPISPARKTGAFIHESAVIDDDVEIGEGTRVWHFCHLLSGARIGRNCVLGQNVMVGPGVAIGDGCKIQNNVSLYRGVTLEDDVFCGPSCVFTNVLTPRAFIERKDAFLPTLVRKGASIGANATVLCGVTIGRYALVGAGAVVSRDVPDHAVVAGVPAAFRGWACRCGAVLPPPREKGILACESCGLSYRLEEGVLKEGEDAP